MSKPRICIDCCLRTNKVICPRCGGQTDIDEYRRGGESTDDADEPDEDLPAALLEFNCDCGEYWSNRGTFLQQCPCCCAEVHADAQASSDRIRCVHMREVVE